MIAVKDLQTELCGDFTNFVIPGRREVHRGSLRKVSEDSPDSSEVPEVSAHLFHDILLTATEGASGYKVFSSKANLLHATVTLTEDNNRRFRVVERDCVTGLVVATHTFQAETAAKALDWTTQILTVANVLGKALRTNATEEPDRVPGAVLAKQKERLEQQVRGQPDCGC